MDQSRGLIIILFPELKWNIYWTNWRFPCQHYKGGGLEIYKI